MEIFLGEYLLYLIISEFLKKVGNTTIGMLTEITVWDQIEQNIFLSKLALHFTTNDLALFSSDTFFHNLQVESKFVIEIIKVDYIRMK